MMMLRNGWSIEWRWLFFRPLELRRRLKRCRDKTAWTWFGYNRVAYDVYRDALRTVVHLGPIVLMSPPRPMNTPSPYDGLRVLGVDKSR